MYGPVFDLYAVAVTISPLASQPGQPAYGTRGVFNTVPINVEALDGSVISEQRTILDIRESEFTVLPMQLDRVTIPADCNGVPLGEWEITDIDTDGVGMSTLQLRRWMPATP